MNRQDLLNELKEIYKDKDLTLSSMLQLKNQYDLDADEFKYVFFSKYDKQLE